jgi:hypothetical protein
MGTLSEAAMSRKFAPRWQIVALRRLLFLDSIRELLTFFCSFPISHQVFASFGPKAGLNGSVVYASLHRCIGREARLTQRIAYTTLGSA